MQSLQHIIVQDDIYSARTALENMKRKIRYRAEGPNDEIVRPITVRDMACHLLTIASINDYKATLEKNFSPQELARLPENLIEPINLKALLIDGRINSIHQPDLFGPRAQAQYDQRYNTIMFPETIVPDQLFNYSKNTGLVPSQIINHELQHAFTDWKRKKLTRATNEAEAHFLEVFYAGLKLGFDFAEQSYQNIFDSNSEYNAEAIKRLEKLTGLDGSNFKDMFPDSEISYRYIAVKLARDMITMVRAGNIIQKVSLQKVAESYATSRSIITFLILISKQSNLDEIVAAMSNNRSLRLDAIEIKEMSSGSISIQNSKVVIPAELDRIGIISRRQIMALKQVFDSDPITGYTVWNNVSKHMFLYLLCKYKLDPNFDTWKYFKETLVPFLTLEYTLVQQDPNDMGTK